MKKKILIPIMVLLLLIGAVGGTMAWLTDKTEPVVNTFTVGDINITLTESENLDLKMIPGKTLTKDPKVTVEAGSEPCWLFVKVEESDNLDDFISYTVDADKWTALPVEAGVYYIEIDSATAKNGVTYSVLTGDQVTVLESVTKTMMDELTTQPTLTFTAYAVQKDGFATAAAAWAEASK